MLRGGGNALPGYFASLCAFVFETVDVDENAHDLVDEKCFPVSAIALY